MSDSAADPEFEFQSFEISNFQFEPKDLKDLNF